jgi:hypothetical protein
MKKKERKKKKKILEEKSQQTFLYFCSHRSDRPIKFQNHALLRGCSGGPVPALRLFSRRGRVQMQ